MLTWAKVGKTKDIRKRSAGKLARYELAERGVARARMRGARDNTLHRLNLRKALHNPSL